MSHSLKSLKGLCGFLFGDIKGDTRSLDSGSYKDYIGVLMGNF